MATYYWVGGSGTWDASAKANWSASSGGAGGSGPPLAADTAIFDANSGTGTCTTALGSICTNATLNSSTLTLTLGANHTMSGTFTLTLGTLDLGSSTFTTKVFSSSNANTRSIVFGTGKIAVTGDNANIWLMTTITGLTVTGTKLVEFTYSGSTGTRSIAHGASVNTGGTEARALNFSVTAGTDTVDMVNTGVLYVNNLDFTGFSGTLSDIRYNVYGNLTFSTGMTLTASTSTTSFVGTGVTQNITTNGKTLDFPIVFNGVGSTFVFQDALTQGSTRAFTVTNGTVKLKNGVTSTVGSFATSGANPKFLQSTTVGSQATLSQSSGTVSVSNLTIQDINAVGGATFNSFATNGNVDGGNNSGWDFNIPQIGRYIFTRRKNKRILP